MKIISEVNKYGLCYSILPVVSAETACIQLIGRVGSNQDQLNGTVSTNPCPSKIGLSHLLEHTVIENSPTKTLLNKLVSMGNKFIAATSRDEVIFGAHVLKQDIKLGIELMASILNDDLNENLNLNQVKNTVTSEIYRNENNSRKKARQNFYTSLYPNTRLALQNIGDAHSISKITFADLKVHKYSLYHPRNFKLVIAGKLAQKDISPEINKIGSPNLTRVNASTYKFQANPQNDSINTKYTKEKLKYFIGGCENVLGTSPLKYPSLILANIVRPHFNNILKNAGLAYKNSVDAYCGQSFGTFTFYAEIAPEKAKILPLIVNKLINTLTLTQSDVDIATNRLIADLIFLNEKIAFKTNYYAENFLHNPEFSDHLQEIHKIKKVKITQVEQALETIRNKPKVFVTD